MDGLPHRAANLQIAFTLPEERGGDSAEHSVFG